MDINEIRRRRTAVIVDMRKLHDSVTERAMTEDEEKRYNDMKAQVAAFDAQLARLEELDTLTASTRSNPGEQPRNQAPAHNRGPRGDSEANAWRAYLRDGDRSGLAHLLRPGEERGERPQVVLTVPSQRETRMILEERAVVDSTMNITTAEDGKNLVPTTLVGQVALRKNERMLAERLGCQRVPGVGTTVNFPVEKADPEDFPTTSEQSDAHGNNYERGAFQTDLKAFTLVKKTRKVELTEEMLEDNGVDLMAYIADKIAREIARTHNGMLAAEVESNGTSLKTLASATAIAGGELEAMLGNDTLGYYLEDATDIHWVMRSSTHWAIKALRGDARLYAGDENGLLGYDVLHSNKVDAIGANGKSVYVGDWNYMGYRESPEIRFIQDPYTVDGMVVLKYSFRGCYGILQAGAIGYGVHPAS
jgi:HK97 family phage major capsid protein